jgi:hypothetical protein
MTVEQLYEVLKKAQEPKGFYFNKDKRRVFELLEALLTNKERYGYMCCPCRLAAEDRDWDQDIICPVSTGSRMWPNSAVAIATSTSPRPGTTKPCPTSTCRSGGP